MESVTVKRIRKIFFEKDGLPKKECLMTVWEILNKLGFNLKEMTRFEKQYYRNLVDSCISCIRQFCREHHILWVDVKVEGCKYIKHGFSASLDHIENSLRRIKTRYLQFKKIYKRIEVITQDQQLFLFDKKDEKYFNN